MTVTTVQSVAQWHIFCKERCHIGVWCFAALQVLNLLFSADFLFCYSHQQNHFFHLILHNRRRRELPGIGLTVMWSWSHVKGFGVTVHFWSASLPLKRVSVTFESSTNKAKHLMECIFRFFFNLNLWCFELLSNIIASHLVILLLRQFTYNNLTKPLTKTTVWSKYALYWPVIL